MELRELLVQLPAVAQLAVQLASEAPPTAQPQAWPEELSQAASAMLVSLGLVEQLKTVTAIDFSQTHQKGHTAFSELSQYFLLPQFPS